MVELSNSHLDPQRHRPRAGVPHFRFVTYRTYPEIPEDLRRRRNIGHHGKLTTMTAALRGEHGAMSRQIDGH